MTESSLHAQLDHMIECFLNATMGYSTMRGEKKVDARTEYVVTHQYESYTLSEDEEICRKAKSAAEKIGLTPQLISGMGGTDANNFNKHGIKVLLLGTGIKDAHTKHESIAISDMVKSTELLLEILQT
jgi:tripeptide aminopeptidase